MNVKLLPIQGILALLRRVLPGRIGRCSPEQAELLRAAEHRQNDLGEMLSQQERWSCLAIGFPNVRVASVLCSATLLLSPLATAELTPGNSQLTFH